MSNFHSMALSSVMDDIGVTGKMVAKRRRSFLIMEVIDTYTLRILGKKVTTYNLGSQSEGTTTVDLDSDIDTLFEYHDLNPIENWEKAEPNAQNVLMVQDKNTAPGHCFLQVKAKDISFPYHDIKFDEHKYFTDSKGRRFLKNICFDDMVAVYDGRNGPAHSFKGNSGRCDEDNVIAFHCKYWPTEAQQWLVNDGKGIWPSEDLKRKCKETGCTIVPISSKGSQFEKLEWRISTCLAERCLMFSLNITQIRCHVLMKMIRKTFIEPKCPGSISSYICKTVLFHCLQNENSLNWQDDQLIRCLETCLIRLEAFVRAENCPNFMIPENNLLKGKLPHKLKMNLLVTLNELKKNVALSLRKISFDDLGWRFMDITNVLPQENVKLDHPLVNPESIRCSISTKLLWHVAAQLSIRHKNYLDYMMLCKPDMSSYIHPIEVLENMSNNKVCELEMSAYKLVIPLFSSLFNSTLASYRIEKRINIHPFPDYVNSDVSSCKLKQASVLYSSGEFGKATDILHTLQQRYDTHVVETMCKCNAHDVHVRHGFHVRANTGDEELIQDIISLCVRFLPCEVNCVPRELQYEMFRSTAEDMQYRHPNDYWMNWAVVDSLPYLYFLQYKIYGHLHETEKQMEALAYLFVTVLTEKNLGHKETALNLLGQCMAQEKLDKDALDSYIRSLNIRPRNNAATIHICILISSLMNTTYAQDQQSKAKKRLITQVLKVRENFTKNHSMQY